MAGAIQANFTVLAGVAVTLDPGQWVDVLDALVDHPLAGVISKQIPKGARARFKA